MAVSTVTNLTAMMWLMNRQSSANYAMRICTSLVLNTVIFTALAISTLFSAAASPYMFFTMLCVFGSSLSTAFSQNGVFAFVPQFGGIYMQAIMT